MSHVPQYLKALLDNASRSPSFHIDDKTQAARLVFETWIVKSLFVRPDLCHLKFSKPGKSKAINLVVDGL